MQDSYVYHKDRYVEQKRWWIAASSLDDMLHWEGYILIVLLMINKIIKRLEEKKQCRIYVSSSKEFISGTLHCPLLAELRIFKLIFALSLVYCV